MFWHFYFTNENRDVKISLLLRRNRWLRTKSDVRRIAHDPGHNTPLYQRSVNKERYEPGNCIVKSEWECFKDFYQSASNDDET